MIKASYIDHMGSDLTVVNAARVSFKSESKELTDRDKKLLDYLAKHDHLSPFEHCVLTVRIECPLYIRSQIMRHRTFSYNEVSRRYTSKGIEFYNAPTYKEQHKDAKQCSGKTLSGWKNFKARQLEKRACKKALKNYEKMLELGVSRETARGVLPQNTMTSFYMTGNLRNWVHFLELRLGKDAQEEVRKIAKDVYGILTCHFNGSLKALAGAKDFSSVLGKTITTDVAQPPMIPKAETDAKV